MIENGGDVEFPQRYDEKSDEEANDKQQLLSKQEKDALE